MNNIEEVMALISRVGHICLTIEKLHLNLIEENKTRAQYNRKGHSTNCIENLQNLSLRLLLYLCYEYLETIWVPISKVSNPFPFDWNLYTKSCQKNMKLS